MMQQSFANVLKNVGEALEASQSRKRAACMSPDGTSSGQGANKTSSTVPHLPGQAAPPLTKPQSSMVSDMVQAALKSALTGMGEAIEVHIVAATTRLDSHDKKHQETNEKLNYTNNQLVRQEEQIGKLISDVGFLRMEAEASSVRALVAEQTLAAIGAAGPPPGLQAAGSTAASSSAHRSSEHTPCWEAWVGMKRQNA